MVHEFRGTNFWDTLYICIRYLTRQFIYPSKAKSLLIREFYSFSMLRDHFVLRLGARRPQDLPWRIVTPSSISPTITLVDYQPRHKVTCRPLLEYFIP